MRDRAVLRPAPGEAGPGRMAAVAREQIAREGWCNVTLVQSPAEGFGRPWNRLEQLTEGVRVREVALGSSYIMIGRAPRTRS